MTGPLVTVIVLNYEGEALLPGCLDALAKQDLEPELWQVWVVDNASTDRSRQILAERYPHIHTILSPRNLGFAGGNNLALRQLTTPYAVLLNNDTNPEPTWLRELIAPLRDGADPRLAATTSKLVFQPRFVTVNLHTQAFQPPGDPRTLGVRISHIHTQQPDGTWAEVTEQCLWERAAYGPEDHATSRFRWTFPDGSLLIPTSQPPDSQAPLQLRLTAQAERAKDLTLTWPGGHATLHLTADPAEHTLTLPLAPDTCTDVINNTGVILHAPGYGADRGYQQPDRGQYDQPEEVFGACGGAACLRTDILATLGVLDDDFFMYYEDTDLSWRLQAAGHTIRYVPTAVVRHAHAASSKEWSPFFTFHVERNRLLMLIKNAPAALALDQILRYVLTAASMTLRGLGTPGARRTAVRQARLRGRVLASLLRLTPRMLARRREINQHRQVSQRALVDRWMLPSKALLPPGPPNRRLLWPRRRPPSS